MDNNAANSLYDLLVTRNLEPELLDSAGKSVMDPSKADMFSFNWKTDSHDYGTVVILIDDHSNMEVYFGDNIGRTMEGDDKSEWYQFLEQLKTFSTRNLLTFQLNNINRLKYTMQGISAIKEGLFEGYYGKKRISYSDQPQQTRLMIKHNRDLGEGEARYRAIESLFVETADGERFKLPFRNLLGGRIMARHVSEGGTPYDAFGQHIAEIVEEMGTLGRFIRAARTKKFSGDTSSLVEAAVRHYSDLKAKAKRMIGQRGYQLERESYDPSELTDSNVAADAIRDMFIEQSIDHRIEEALPILAKLAPNTKEDSMKEVDEFESWTNKVMEGTWALPETPEAEAKLKELMSKPLIVGPDATNATEQLYDLVGDDELFDRLNDLADQDPNANCWDDPAIVDRLGELGIDITPTAGSTAGDQGVTEGSGYDGSEPLDLSKNPSVNDVFKRALYIYDYEGYGNDMDYSEDDAIDQYVAQRFGQDVLDQLTNARNQQYFGRDDGRGGPRGSNLGQPSQPGGNFRTTKAGVMNKQDAKTIKSRVADRLGRHPEPNLPEAEDDIVRLRRLLGQNTTEDLDTDGVMMTKPSNMSS